MATYLKDKAYNRRFFLVSSTDHVTKKTGATPTVSICKPGGAFAAASGAVSEIGQGWYQVALSASDTDTEGDLLFHVTASGADDTDFADQVAVAQTAGGLLQVKASIPSEELEKISEILKILRAIKAELKSLPPMIETAQESFGHTVSNRLSEATRSASLKIEDSIKNIARLVEENGNSMLAKVVEAGILTNGLISAKSEHFLESNRLMIEALAECCERIKEMQKKPIASADEMSQLNESVRELVTLVSKTIPTEILESILQDAQENPHDKNNG